LLQKSFWGVEQKFLEPLMRFARGDVRDHIDWSKIDLGISIGPKSISDLRNGADNRRSCGQVLRSAFARFLWLFDFRLLQQNQLKASVVWGQSLLAPDGDAAAANSSVAVTLGVTLSPLR
jgi:hypothetical protein